MRTISCLVAMALLVVTESAQARSWEPDRPLRIVVPYAPGVGADIGSRVLSAKLQEIWKQPVIIENRAGASGAIGTNTVIHSAPDGYTMLITGESLYSVYMAEAPAYDPVKDITPVAQVVGLPFAFLTRKNFPASTWVDFVAYARAHPNKVTISTPGYGTPHHILTEFLMRDVGVDLYQVPGTSNVIQDVLAERLDSMFQPASVAARLLASGLKALAAGGDHRTTTIPESPSFAELGVNALVGSNSVNGMFVANGTPPEAIATLANGFKLAPQDPAIAGKLIGAGFTVEFLPSDAYGQKVRATAARWEKILADFRRKRSQ